MAFFRLLCYQQTYYHRDEAFCRHITVSACPAYGCGGGADELYALHHSRPARSLNVDDEKNLASLREISNFAHNNLLNILKL